MAAEAREIREDRGFVRFVAISGWQTGELELLANRPEIAEHELRQSCELLEESGDKGLMSSVAGVLGEALCQLGRFEEAEEFSLLAEAAAAELDIDAQVRWRLARAEVHESRGDVEAAAGLAAEAVRLTAGTDFVMLAGQAHLRQAAILARVGRSEEAGDSAGEALGLFTAKGHVVAAKQAKTLLNDLGLRPKGEPGATDLSTK